MHRILSFIYGKEWVSRKTIFLWFYLSSVVHNFLYTRGLTNTSNNVILASRFFRKIRVFFLSHIGSPVLSDRVIWMPFFGNIGTDSEGMIDFVCFSTKTFLHCLKGNVFLLPSITGKHSGLAISRTYRWAWVQPTGEKRDFFELPIAIIVIYCHRKQRFLLFILFLSFFFLVLWLKK